MDFSSPTRALESIPRRRPALPDDILNAARILIAANDGDSCGAKDEAKSEAEATAEEKAEACLEQITLLIRTDHDRWEGLAVGLLLGTEILAHSAEEAARSGRGEVYIDGPRVPAEEKTGATGGSGTTLTTRSYGTRKVSLLATTLYEATLRHLEHSEPRIRTFVARAVGAHATWSVGIGIGNGNGVGNGVGESKHEHEHEHEHENENENENELCRTHKEERDAIHEQIMRSVNKHIRQGRDDPEKYSKSSTGALDDTTGWRALETNWQCLACWIASLGPGYYDHLAACENAGGSETKGKGKGKGKGEGGSEISEMDLLLQNLEYSAVTHVNRHVRAAAIAVLEQLIVAAGSEASCWHHLESGGLRATTVRILRAGLADNWSQVRMAASVLNRVFWTTLQETCRFPPENLEKLYPVLVPRMCLNRFYLAQGVKLYSHQTWKLVFPENGVRVVARSIAPVVRYYVKMCDADNHVVREGACQAVAELAVRIGGDGEHHSCLQPHVPVLLQALLMCFHDESWPVRDEACLACGIFCRAYPQDCLPELPTLWTRWTEQLTDQIWSVRADAAVALGQACQAYGEDFSDRLLAFVRDNLPAARDQPRMTLEEYKAWQNDVEAHTENQLYSCGSLAPKLGKKAGAGRIGCSSCAINRPKQPWEATDGCVYLLRELVETRSGPDSVLPPLADDVLLPLLTEVADVCRVSHFPQSNDLRATLWRQLPGMMHAVGKTRCKRLYLDLFLDLLMANLGSKTASALSIHAAGACASELSQLVGHGIFRGRLADDFQREALDRALSEREEENRSPMARALQQHQQQGAAFSPFEPPGLLDTPYTQKMQPGLPEGFVHPLREQDRGGRTFHPGTGGLASV